MTDLILTLLSEANGTLTLLEAQKIACALSKALEVMK